MSVNEEIAEQLDEIARLMELLGENRFRIAALSRASRICANLSDDLAQLADDRAALLAIDGVGERIADMIQEYIRTGAIEERETCAHKIPPGLLEVLALPGLGPKTVGLLWREKGVESLSDLQRRIDDGSILDLPRMGKKSVEKIRRAMAFAQANSGKTPIGLALPLAEEIVRQLKQVAGAGYGVIAGSLRRGRDSVGDIDILATANDPGALSKAFVEMPDVVETLAAGETKSSLRLSMAVGDTVKSIQVDLRIVPDESFGAALLYFTGSKDHNIKLRQRAIMRGMTLNEYGLQESPPSADQPPQEQGVAPTASTTEEAIYASLDLPWIAPEMRQGRDELSLDSASYPKLIQLSDIHAELHAHTTASDGSLSILELAAEAKRRGFHTVAVTDHSKSQTIANGLSPDRLRLLIAAVRHAQEQIDGVTILAGSEVDILPDGSLDYDDDLLAELDIVVASPHWSLSQTPTQATSRLLRAVEHPLVDILGHPTGRLIGRREGLSPAIGEIAAAAVEHNTALEINSHWMRLDLRDAHVRSAVQAGALIAINCDVHTPGNFDNLRYGVMTARRGWLTPERCVNAWSSGQLLSWLKDRRR